MAVGQNLRYLFGDDYPPKVVYFKGFWDVHRGSGVLTHGHIPKLFKTNHKTPLNWIQLEFCCHLGQCLMSTIG